MCACVLGIHHVMGPKVCLRACVCVSKSNLSLRPNVHVIHPKFYVILVIFNTI